MTPLAVGHGKPSAGAEVILHVDDDEGVVGSDLHRFGRLPLRTILEAGGPEKKAVTWGLKPMFILRYFCKGRLIVSSMVRGGGSFWMLCAIQKRILRPAYPTRCAGPRRAGSQEDREKAGALRGRRMVMTVSGAADRDAWSLGEEASTSVMVVVMR